MFIIIQQWPQTIKHTEVANYVIKRLRSAITRSQRQVARKAIARFMSSTLDNDILRGFRLEFNCLWIVLGVCSVWKTFAIVWNASFFMLFIGTPFFLLEQFCVWFFIEILFVWFQWVSHVLVTFLNNVSLL